VTVIGFLHTAESHVETFGALVEDVDPAHEHVHAVRPDLLERARQHGVDDQALADELRGAIQDLAARDARVVLCTCSTLGGVSEQCAGGLGVDVLRVDRPMAGRAVRIGSRIGVVAALESTLTPTCSLLYEEALAAGKQITVIEAPCFEAWGLFEDGDIAGYQRDVAKHIDQLEATIDVVILAQASMAAAAPLVNSDRVVLTSPRTAIETAVRLANIRS
jgi:hypothetical protein